jgi:adenine-specific DNA methylase
MTPDRPSPNSRGLSGVVRYGIDRFGKLFNARQALAMTTFVKAIHALPLKFDSDYGKAISTLLAMAVDRQANQATTVCRMDVTRETLQGTYSRQALAMTWDYAEVNPIGDATGGFFGALEWVYRVVSNAVIPDAKVVIVNMVLLQPFLLLMLHSIQ